MPPGKHTSNAGQRPRRRRDAAAPDNGRPARSTRRGLRAIEVLDNGKPITEAREDIELAVDHFRYFAGAARNIEGKTVPHKELHIQTRREPYGVVGQVVPWNFPLLLAAGNSHRHSPPATPSSSPAEQTPVRLAFEREDSVPTARQGRHRILPRQVRRCLHDAFLRWLSPARRKWDRA